MNEITIASGVLLLVILWGFLGMYLGERYDFFPLPLMILVPVFLVFIISFFI